MLIIFVTAHRRQAALQEVQRLRVEGSLRPVVPGSSEVQESGSLTISAITLPLKKDFFLNYKAGKYNLSSDFNQKAGKFK